MDLGLKGKKALVMGSTRGMGLGIAARLAAEGASVAVCGRNLVDAQDAASGIDGSRAYALDLSDVKSVDALIEAVGADVKESAFPFARTHGRTATTRQASPDA